MTQEEKQLLLKDLCGRLPYDVIAVDHYDFFVLFTWRQMKDFEDGYISKPFLRPMSSMTEEERKEYKKLLEEVFMGNMPYISASTSFYDWLNAHHFDYRGLIPMGLALEAPKGLYGKEEEK